MSKRVCVSVFLLTAFALFIGACGHSPSGNSPVAPTVPTPVQNVVARIWGVINDTAFRPLAGVRVEIIDEPQASAPVVSDANGVFSFSGALVGATVTLRATKEGYVTATRTLDQRLFSGGNMAGIGINLEPLVPPVKIEAGDYTLTLIADSACADIPNDLRTRIYGATITPESTVATNTQYHLTLSGPFLTPNPFLPRIGIAGNDLAFEFAEEGSLYEHLPHFTYLQIAGAGVTSVETSPVSTISTRFGGVFEYCVLKSEMGRYSNCITSPPDQVITRSTCVSKNNQLILTRR